MDVTFPASKPHASSRCLAIITALLAFTCMLLLAVICWASVMTALYTASSEMRTTSAKASAFDNEWNPSTEEADPSLSGRWDSVIPMSPPSSSIADVIGMQTVHSVLLPSGKVLLASGSSWRNLAGKTQIHPFFLQPEPHSGLFNKSTNPFEWAKAASYYSLVNNVGIFDPAQNMFFRIPHPLPSQPDPDNSSWFLPTDLFCTSHMHLRDGKVLFFGGTQFYAPQRTGTRTTHIFDWTKELKTNWTTFDWTTMPNSSSPIYPWVWSGFMRQGRWYPHAVPLLDGRMVIMGGYIGFDKTIPDMYPFEINHRLEFFDYNTFLNSTDPQAAWYDIDVKDYVNSPFNTLLPQWAPKATGDCVPRECEAYKRDAFKLYPQNYLLPDGRIYMTREGDFNSLRTVNATCIRRTKFTYFLSVSGSNANDTQVAFSRGPDRPAWITMSGTTVIDPNNNGQTIMLIGGMNISTGGTMLPGLYPQLQEATDFVTTSSARQYAGSRGSRKLEVYTLPDSNNKDGSWQMKDTTFLGDVYSDDRTMHYAIILPTKQILIINGGNYDFAAPVFYPLLLTPVYQTGTFTGNYIRTRLAPSPQPRLYHNIALLLADGRVLIAGGNACRAIVDPTQPLAANSSSSWGQKPPNVDRVQLDLYFLTDSSIGNGFTASPAENWVMEIFSPPYLFVDGMRRVEIQSIEWVPKGSNDQFRPDRYHLKSLNGLQTFYLFHSRYRYNITLQGLPTPNKRCYSNISNTETDGSLVLIKLGSSTHGWDAAQKLYQLQFRFIDGTNVIQTDAPDARAKDANLVPAFYMLYYVDCRDKPSHSVMVRFDDEADSAI